MGDIVLDGETFEVEFVNTTPKWAYHVGGHTTTGVTLGISENNDPKTQDAWVDMKITGTTEWVETPDQGRDPNFFHQREHIYDTTSVKENYLHTRYLSIGEMVSSLPSSLATMGQTYTLKSVEYVPGMITWVSGINVTDPYFKSSFFKLDTLTPKLESTNVTQPMKMGWIYNGSSKKWKRYIEVSLKFTWSTCLRDCNTDTETINLLNQVDVVPPFGESIMDELTVKFSIWNAKKKGWKTKRIVPNRIRSTSDQFPLISGELHCDRESIGVKPQHVRCPGSCFYIDSDIELNWLDFNWEKGGNSVGFVFDPKKSINKSEFYEQDQEFHEKALLDYTACEESFEVFIQIYLSKTQNAKDVKVIWDHREHYTAQFAPGKRTDSIKGIDEPQHPERFGGQWGPLTLIGLVPDKEWAKLTQVDRWGQLKYPYRGACINVCPINHVYFVKGKATKTEEGKCEGCWHKVPFDVLPPLPGDSDGDGVSDVDEVEAGTDPLNPQDKP